jgi:hypothetical protein
VVVGGNSTEAERVGAGKAEVASGEGVEKRGEGSQENMATSYKGSEEEVLGGMFR